MLDKMATAEDDSNTVAAALPAATIDEADDSSDSSSDESDSEQPSQIEWLATGRARRSTAGNRMKSMLAIEAPADDQDDLELLFAEDEGDVEFEGGEDDAQSDVQFDSSDEAEDDQRPPDEEGKEDLEGERELQKQSRAERQAKKRKTQDGKAVETQVDEKTVAVPKNGDVAAPVQVEQASPPFAPMPPQRS